MPDSVSASSPTLLTPPEHDERLREQIGLLAPKRRRQTCGAACPGGGTCCLSDQAPHAWHYCANARCVCHQTWRTYLDTGGAASLRVQS